MFDQILVFLHALLDQTGLMTLWWGNLVMIAVGVVMIYLALAKHYEPFLLIGIGSLPASYPTFPAPTSSRKADCSTSRIKALRCSSCRR